MPIEFSKMATSLKASEIREILKITQMPDVISFAGGMPAPELFPIKEMEDICVEVLKNNGRSALQYSTTEGFKPLRDLIAKERMSAVGVNTTADNILITSGSQQGLEFSSRLFLNEGDIVLCESPTYLGAINAFKLKNPKFIEVPMDESGMIISELEKLLKIYPNAKMIYTIPDFQNPTGKTLSLKRREELAKIAEEYEIPVIEDNPYGELNFTGTKYPSVKSFDKKGYVIYLGSFSKTFCPGLRMAWVCADEAIIHKYTMLKQVADVQCSSIAQRETALFMQKHNLNDHINKLIEVYKKRRDVMLNSMKEYFPKEVKFTYPEGGLFTWVEVKEDIDASELLKESLKVKVAFVPGKSFFPNGTHKNFFRLNYSTMNEEKIVEGIKRLATVLNKYY